MVAPYSVSRHTAQITETIAFTNATNRDGSRQDAVNVASETHTVHKQTEQTTEPDTPRLAATGRDMSHEEKRGEPAPDNRYVKLLEDENKFLKDQISIKDTQITELGERARETNFLIKGLQDLFLRLQPGRSDKIGITLPLAKPTSIEQKSS